jgi:CBS domain containing-hemolysin-like protein
MDRASLWVEGAWPPGPLTVDEFVRRQAGRIPEQLEQLTIAGLAAEVEAVEGGTVTSLIVAPPTGEGD